MGAFRDFRYSETWLVMKIVGGIALLIACISSIPLTVSYFECNHAKSFTKDEVRWDAWGCYRLHDDKWEKIKDPASFLN